MPCGPAMRLLPDGKRLHLQHGPIDLVIEAFGAGEEIALAYGQAQRRFATVLPELVAELPLLRRAVDAAHPGVEGPVARRMLAACRPHSGAFITPMAAVAGAVADEVLGAMLAGRRLDKAYVNKGGDIALHIAPGRHLDVGLVANVESRALAGSMTIDSSWPVRGIATSGWRGRSFSLGIADAATVLAQDAAAADAAATLVANAVDIDHPAITRARACHIDETSDLGERLVTRAVNPLPSPLIDIALDRGAAVAAKMRRAGLIFGAVLVLQSKIRVIGNIARALSRQSEAARSDEKNKALAQSTRRMRGGRRGSESIASLAQPLRTLR
jgi:ApbE superfamily uncharacterized protein (UPF0280 family)